MKVERIINIIQTYNTIQQRIAEDTEGIKNNTIAKRDEQKARMYKIRLAIDNEVLGRFLDEEV